MKPEENTSPQELRKQLVAIFMFFFLFWALVLGIGFTEPAKSWLKKGGEGGAITQKADR